ncbi:hypothetical protein ACFLYB_03180 [Chloroflexota bacterium]
MEIIAKCPQCKGAGRVQRELPFGANPKAPATRAEKTNWKDCSHCCGSGSIGIKQANG